MYSNTNPEGFGVDTDKRGRWLVTLVVPGPESFNSWENDGA